MKHVDNLFLSQFEDFFSSGHYKKHTYVYATRDWAKVVMDSLLTPAPKWVEKSILAVVNDDYLYASDPKAYLVCNNKDRKVLSIYDSFQGAYLFIACTPDDVPDFDALNEVAEIVENWRCGSNANQNV